MPKNTFGLNKTLVLFSAAAAAIVGAAIVATMPSSGTLEAHERTVKEPACQTEQIPLDEGYGVSRFVSRRVCTDR